MRNVDLDVFQRKMRREKIRFSFYACVFPYTFHKCDNNRLLEHAIRTYSSMNVYIYKLQTLNYFLFLVWQILAY